MYRDPYASVRFLRDIERKRRRNRALVALALVGTGIWTAFGFVKRDGVEQREPAAVRQVADSLLIPAHRARPIASAPRQAWLLDPKPALHAEAPGWGSTTPLSPDLTLAAVKPEPAQQVADAATNSLTVATTQPTSTAARLALIVPPPRPLEFRRPLSLEPRRLAARDIGPSTRSVFSAAVPQEQEPSFFEEMLGLKSAPAQSSNPALAYASPDSAAIPSGPAKRLTPAPSLSIGARTAIYDITAKRVYLPSGKILEAHSGLGSSMDNPAHVHMRMRGSTPPGTYDLTEREALFHGVRAIRLTPVGGSGAIHGRNGILAHTYMLGPSGASNGCVSFRDYNSFLQAFLRGEVQRLVVVASLGQLNPFLAKL